MGNEKLKGHARSNQQAITPEKDWLIENRLDPEGTRREFLDWLRASPDNVRKYLVESALMRAMPAACAQLGSLDDLVALARGEGSESALARAADAKEIPPLRDHAWPPGARSVKPKVKC
jgi:hypothetical protein